MNNSHYNVDMRYTAANVKAGIDLLMRLNEEGTLPKVESDEYLVSRIRIWYDIFRNEPDIFNVEARKIENDTDLLNLFKSTVHGIYTSMEESNGYVIALLEIGALERVSDY